MAAREHEEGSGDDLDVDLAIGSMLLLPVPGSDLSRSYASSLRSHPLLFCARFSSMTLSKTLKMSQNSFLAKL